MQCSAAEWLAYFVDKDEKACNRMCKVYTIYELEIKEMTKFLDTFVVVCKNYRKSNVEDDVTYCQPPTSGYLFYLKYLIMKQNVQQSCKTVRHFIQDC